MTVWQFIHRSLLHHWRINLAVVFGVAAATSVLVGALLVGDSMTGSLRDLSLARLGRVDALLISPNFFRVELVDQLVESPEFASRYDAAVPAIVFPRGTVEWRRDEGTHRASRVLVVASQEGQFWDLCRQGVRPRVLPGEDQIVLNAALAEELGVAVGDVVTIRLPDSLAIPADSPLGEKEDRIRGITELEVVDVVPVQGLGRFSLTASQARPLTCFVSLQTLQDPLDQEGKVNTILVAGKSGVRPPGVDECDALSGWLRPTLSDVGLSLRRVRLPFEVDGEPRVAFDYFSLTSAQMVMHDEAATVAEAAFAVEHAQPVLTYLANAIIKLPVSDDELATAGIPYSTVAAVDATPQLGPLQSSDGSPLDDLANDEIVVNRWAAEDQGIQVGDRVKLIYFEPETTHGVEVEVSEDFTVRAIVSLTEPDDEFDGDEPPHYSRMPTLVNDPWLTPEVDGITDQESIDNWEIPFELTRKTRVKDDDYYKRHRLTPKAFVSLATGQRLWGSRFGKVTSIRIPAPDDLPIDQTDRHIQKLTKKFFDQARRDRARLGLQFMPVKAQALAAAAGTTPFNGLFLGLSLFIILAALMLVSILYQLGVDRRAAEIGLLLANGFQQKKVTRLFVGEGVLVALVGAACGLVCGIAYAWLMIAGLRTIWVGAITVAFLQFHWTPVSLVMGYMLGVVICVITIALSMRRLRWVSTRRLLAGQTAEAMVARSGGRGKLITIAVPVLVVLGLACLVFAATALGGEMQAICFVSGGVMLLTGMLLLIRAQIRAPRRRAAGSLSAGNLAMKNTARNPGRSTMTIGLIATASFLIVAMSSFRLNPSLQGAGGFQLVGETSEPIFVDLNDAEVRAEYLASDTDPLQDADVLALRLQPGDDASCNNLYRATRPRVLGVPEEMVRFYDNADLAFEWAGSTAKSEEDQKNPWRLLEQTLDDGAIPVIIDKNTAMYSLQIYALGQEKTFTYEGAGDVTFRVVGMLANSVLQGNLLISEAHFKQLFPQTSGHQYFLIASSPASQQATTQALEDAFGDQGMDVRSTAEILTNLMAVQNTYLSTFQSLGALGLLLGTFGLAAVQLRSILERRSELALLRAAGFTSRRLSQIVMLENMTLLLGGLATGVAAALFAVLPHYLFGQASIPGWELTAMLLLVLLVGVVTALWTIRSVLQAPLLSALRGD